MNEILEYIIFIVLLLLVDSIWVVGAKKIHTQVIEKVQNSTLQINFISAILFYLLASLGYIFIVKPLAKDSKSAFLYGLLLGLLMYGTFDLTNKAIFTNYPWAYALADMCWGALVFGTVSTIVFKISH
jgi:uncharacterized membrane protein